MGIAMVTPISKVIEILETAEEFQKMKREAEENTQRQGLPTPDSAVEEESEFDRFEGLTGRLLKVPKKEFDKEREEEKSGES